jgi:head-tail adaptor
MSEELAGALNERVQVLRWIGGRDATGGSSGYWHPVTTRYASISLDGSPFLTERGGTQRSVRRWRVVMRRDAAISAADQLHWRDMVFVIQTVENDPRAPEVTVLRCESRQP